MDTGERNPPAGAGMVVFRAVVVGEGMPTLEGWDGLGDVVGILGWKGSFPGGCS